MKENIKNRLTQLQQEYKKGQEQLQKLEQETANIRSAMFRISGAVQVLEELLQEEMTNQAPDLNNTQKKEVAKK